MSRGTAVLIGLLCLAVAACASDSPATSPDTSPGSSALASIADSAPSTTTTASSIPDVDPTTAPTVVETVPPTTAGPTTAVPTSIVYTTVTETTTTTSAAPDPGFELRVDGIGDLDFGTDQNAAIDTVGGALGAPIADDSLEFPEPSDSLFQNNDTGLAFASPFGRSVCWPAFCVYFGGTDPLTLSFAGWSFSDELGVEPGPLTTRDGVTLGSRWSDFLGVLNVEPGGCYTAGFGTTADGIRLGLLGGDFSVISDSGEYVALLPDPTEVTVYDMRAGNQIFSFEGDC